LELTKDRSWPLEAIRCQYLCNITGSNLNF